MFIISPVGTCFSSPRQHVYCDRWSWRFGWVGQFFVRFVIRLVSKLELFIFRPPSFFSLTTRFLAEVIGLRPALGESHQSFAAFYRGQLSRLNPGPNRAFRIPILTSLLLSQPCFGAIMGALGPSLLHHPRLLSCIRLFSAASLRGIKGGAGAVHFVVSSF